MGFRLSGESHGDLMMRWGYDGPPSLAWYLLIPPSLHFLVFFKDTRSEKLRRCLDLYFIAVFLDSLLFLVDATLTGPNPLVIIYILYHLIFLFILTFYASYLVVCCMILVIGNLLRRVPQDINIIARVLLLIAWIARNIWVICVWQNYPSIYIRLP